MRSTCATRVIPAVVAVVCACVGAAAQASAEPKRVVAAPRPPVVFEEGRGRLDPRTAFVSRNRHFVLAIASNEVLLAPKTSGGTAPLRMRFVGGASDAVVSGVNPLPGTIYYVDGQTAGRPSPVHTYDRVSAARVYPGVDVEYYATDEQLEFDFVIAPYADPRRIRLAFSGASGIVVSENGDLAMRVGGEELRLKKPVVYQRVAGGRRAVNGQFVLGADQTASLALGPYDTSLPLIVDPVVTFATYLGSASDDTVVSLQSDSAGNVYIFGRTFDQTTFPTTTPVGTNILSTPKCFVSKLDASGSQLIYSIVYVDSFLVNNDALCDAMTVTPEGHVALAYTSGGSLGNLSFAKTVSVFQTDQSGPTSMTNFWAQHLEGLLPVRAIDIDSSANVYLLGACVNARHDFPQPLFPGGYRRQPLDGSHCTTDSIFTTGPSESVLAKYGPGGAWLYATYIGGAGDEEPMAYALDATDAGVAYVAGATRSTSFPVTADAYQPACGAGCSLDAFLQAIDTTQPNDASLIYSSYFGDASEDLATAVHVEANGVVTVAGSGTIAGPGPDQNFTPGTFVARFVLSQAGAAQLNQLTLFPYGHELFFYPAQFAFFSDGGFAISGATRDAAFPRVNDSGGILSSDIDEPFVSVFAPDGTTLRLSVILAEQSSGLPRIAARGDNDLFAAMDTTVNRLATRGAYQPALAGGVDVQIVGIGNIVRDNQAPTLSTNEMVVVRASSIDGADAVVVASATDPDGDEVTVGWQFGANTAAGPIALFQFPIGTSVATVTADDHHGHQVQATVTVIVRGAVIAAGDSTVHPPAVYDFGGIKRAGFLPDVRLDLQGVAAPGVVSLNVQMTMLPGPPTGYQFGSPPYIYELAASQPATAITACIDTTGMTFADRPNARLFFLNGSTWTDVTSSATGAAVVCGALPAFGSVAIFTPTAAGSGAETLAGTGQFATYTTNPDGSTVVPDGGIATDTPLLGAFGAAIDRQRNVLYLSDFNRIRRVDLTTHLISTVAGNGDYPDTQFDAVGNAYRLIDPDDQRIGFAERLALDSAGRLYIAETSRCRVLRFDPASSSLTRFAGDGVCRSAGDGLPAAQASLISPLALAFDAGGNLFIADATARVVRRVDAVTGLVSTVAGNGTTALHPGQPAVASGMTPADIAVGINGELYVVQDNPFLLRIDTGGDGAVNGGAGETVSVVNTCVLTASCPALPFDGDGGSVADATFHRLYSVAVEASGSLLVGEFDRNRIRRIEADASGVVNGTISTAAGYDATSGDPPTGSGFFFNGDDFALSSGITLPTAIVADPAGGFLWTDNTNPRVRRAGTGSASPAASADLRITVVPSPTDVVVGQTITYTVTVTNDGPAAATGAGVDLPVNPAMTVLSAVNTTSPFQFCVIPIFVPFGTVACGLQELAPGQQAVLSIAVRANQVGALAAHFTVLGQQDDPQPANNSADVEVLVQRTADLAVSIVSPASGTAVGVGHDLTIEAAMSNLGPDTTQGPARLRLPLPSGLQFVSGSIPGGVCDGSFGVVTCDIDVLAAGASPHAVIVVRPVTFGALALAFDVSSTNFDPALANNSTTLALTSMLLVNETVHVVDTLQLQPSLLLPILETVHVIDNVEPHPALMVGINESVHVVDTVDIADTVPPVVTPPASITIGATEAGGARGNLPSSASSRALSDFIASGSAVDDRDPAPVRQPVTAVINNATVPVDANTLFPVGVTTVVTFSYADAAGNLGFATAAVTVNAPPKPTTLTLVATPNPTEFGQPVTLTATVSSGDGTPAGEVIFRYRDESVLRFLTAPVPLVNGVATLQLPGFFLGDTEVSAEYAENATHFGSQASMVMHVTRAVTQTTVTSSRNPSLTTGPPIFFAAVDTASHVPPTGSVEFSADGVLLCRSTVYMRGARPTASCGGAPLAAGSHTVTAIFVGNDHFASSTAPALTQTVEPGTYFALDLGFEGEAVALSPHGWVAGNSLLKSALASSLNSSAYVHDGTTTGMARLIPSLGGARTVAVGVDDSGRVAGSATTAAGATHVFLFDGTTSDHHNATFGGANSRATAMNADGTIVGFADTASGAHAFLDVRGGAVDLGTLPGGVNSAALAISRLGHIVGVSTAADGLAHAAAFAPQLTDLSTFTNASSIAAAVNDAGEVAGSLTLADSAAGHAFVYRDNVMHDIGPSVGAGASLAMAINDAGQVAGTFDDDATGTAAGHSFLYSLDVPIDLGPGTFSALNNAGAVVTTALGRILVRTGGGIATIGGPVDPGNVSHLPPAVNATAMNDDGRIAGSIMGASGRPRAVVWIPVGIATLSVEPAHGRSGGSVVLAATLTDATGPVANKTVRFRLNGADAGSAVTDADGRATLSASVMGIAEGSYPDALEAFFEGDETLSGAYDTAELTIDPAGVTITWPQPAPIVQGTLLGAAQLNATANVAGTFVYSPPAGTAMLQAGTGQTLSVTFTPDDPADGPATATVLIDVTPAPLTVTVVAPAGGSRVFVGVPTTIRWQASGFPMTFDVELATGSGPFVPIAACENLPASETSCEWTPAPVGGRLGGSARVRVTAHDATQVAAATSGSFSISPGAPLVRVASPNTAVRWATGTTRTITWAHNLGAGSFAKIELSRDGGATWEVLAASVPNATATQGQFDWQVTGPATAAALIRVGWADGPTADESNVPFAIEAPRITVTSPNGGEQWVFNSSHGITWSHNLGTGENVAIELSRDGGVTWSTLGASVGNTGSTTGQFNWVVTGPDSAHARVRVRWLHFFPHGFGEVADDSDADFRIGSRIRVTSPNTAVSWAAGSRRTVTWTVDAPGLQNFDVDVSADGGATWTAGAHIPYSSPITSGQTTILLPGVLTTQALVRVSPAGQPGEGDVSDVPFSLVAPSLTVSNPLANESWVIGSTHRIRFSSNLGTSTTGFTVDASSDGGATWRGISSFLSLHADSPAGRFYLDWNVTGPVGTHARIRVTWNGGGLTAQDESDEFRIASRIHVTSPNTAVSWAAGSRRSVTWTVDAPGLQNFDVDVSTDGGATWTTGAHIPYSSPTTSGQASILLPGILTTQALVRVSPAGRPGDGDVSDVPFSLVAPSLTVSNPLANESWVIGSTHRIRFSSNLGTSTTGFTVDASSDGGATWRGISTFFSLHADSPAGRFYLDWNVTGPVGTHARIRVTWNGGGLTAQDESDDFTIASRIHVTSPNTAVSWAAATRRSVTWTVDAPGLQNFDVDVSTDGGATWTTGAHNIPYPSPTTSGQASIPLPAILTSQALVRVSPAGRPGDGDVSDVPFSLVAPSLTVSNPFANESWVIGSAHRIRFSSNLGTSTTGFTVDASSDGGATWRGISTFFSLHTDSPAGRFYLDWNVTGPVGTHARIRVTWNGGGLTAQDESDEFTIASRIHVTSPNTAVTWFLGTSHAITWTHNYDAAQMFDIDFSADGGATWTPLALHVQAATATTGSFTWTVGGNATTRALIRVGPAGRPGDGDTSDIPFIVAFPTIVRP